MKQRTWAIRKSDVVHDTWASCKERLESLGPQHGCKRKQNPLYIINVNKSQVGPSLNVRLGSLKGWRKGLCGPHKT